MDIPHLTTSMNKVQPPFVRTIPLCLIPLHHAEKPVNIADFIMWIVLWSTVTTKCIVEGNWFSAIRYKICMYNFFFWCYSPNLGLGLPPWNSLFHYGLLDLRHSVGLLGRVISSSQDLYLYTNTEKRPHRHTHTHTHTRAHAHTRTHARTHTKKNKHHTSIPWVWFKFTIPASEWVKTVHALVRLATVTSSVCTYPK
jgi:ABC-type nickel/cobalt efflux system permease component RcnA